MKARYKCSEDELYDVCGIILLSLKEELADFSAFKAKYDTDFTDALEEAIESARALPNEVQRMVKHEMPRIKLRKRHSRCMKKLRALRLYIMEAFKDEDVQRVRLQDAGFNDYKRAAEKSWEKLIAIMRHGRQFIAANRDALLADDNMPLGFEAQFVAEETDLPGEVVAFKNTRENTLQGTQEKVKANNGIYKRVMSVCADGYFIFGDNVAKREQFVWERVLALVSAPKSAGLRFDVKEQGTNYSLADARVVVQKEGGLVLEAVTDVEGRGMFNGLVPGVYKGRVVLAGFEELVVEFNIRKGVRSLKHWVVKPVNL